MLALTLYLLVLISCSGCSTTFGRHLDGLWHGQGLVCLYHVNVKCVSPWEHQSWVSYRCTTYFRLQHNPVFSCTGKKLVCQAYKDVTETFVCLTGHPFQLLDPNDDHSINHERLRVTLWDKTSALTCVNETGRELFYHKNRATDKRSPPRTPRLLQHIPRPVYRTCIYSTRSQAQLVVPSQHDFAWTKVSYNRGFGWQEVSRSCLWSYKMFLQRRLLKL